jgi:hypothetical protein
MDNSTSTNPSFIEALIAEAERIEEDTLYSCKSHFEAARRWDQWHLWIGIPTALLAAFAGVSALSDYPLVSAIIAFLVAASSGVFTFLNPKERAALHLKAGNAYKTLNNEARIFRQIDCLQGHSPEELSTRLKKLDATRNALNAESPQPPRFAFVRGRKGIEAGEAEYKVDKLPPERNPER